MSEKLAIMTGSLFRLFLQIITGMKLYDLTHNVLLSVVIVVLMALFVSATALKVHGHSLDEVSPTDPENVRMDKIIKMGEDTWITKLVSWLVISGVFNFI